ncbi:hypothetical protein JI59_02060 [Novosphingobium pentaromativorans US6-1]|nr:hypothetical protein JI59_02060 [Novosphingobium pentaromativorans US6-1]
MIGGGASDKISVKADRRRRNTMICKSSGRKLISASAAMALMLAPTGAAMARDRDHDHERHRHHDDGHSAAGVIAGVAIAGVLAAAIASKKKKERERERYYRNNSYYYHHDREAFAPEGSRDTWCYQQTRSCYTHGHYSSRWTSYEFGHDRRF